MPIKVLMVCLGNICRSPLAEGILQSKLNNQDFFIDSAGTGDWHVGQSPDIRSVKIAKKFGIDISKQQAQHFTPKLFKLYDYIFAMDLSNYNNIISLATNSNEKQKVKLILNELYPNQNKEVPDPYYGGEDGFENVYKMLDATCTIIAEKLKKNTL